MADAVIQPGARQYLAVNGGDHAFDAQRADVEAEDGVTFHVITFHV